MRIATWNVNSARARKPRLLDWLDQRRPDVVCLQETKTTDAEFAETFGADLAERGYAIAHRGQKGWNGVAILSRAGLDDVTAAFAGRARLSPTPRRAHWPPPAAGSASSRVYVPNGRTPDDPHYAYKLTWLEALGRSALRHGGARHGRMRRLQHRARPTTTSSTRRRSSARRT